MFAGGSALAASVLQGTPLANYSFLFVLPSLLAAVLIGVRFAWRWWALGLPAHFMVLAALILLRDPNAGIIVGWVIIPLAMICSVYGFLALAGVWWGKRREEDDFPSRGPDIAGDESRFTRGRGDLAPGKD